MKKWFDCPWAYAERYIHEIEPLRQTDALGFGTRLHQLLEEHYKGLPSGTLFPPSTNPEVENEVQVMFAAYKAHYPVEDFDVVAVEQFFKVPLPDSPHEYCGEFDSIIRMKDTGRLKVFETKTEKRGSKNNSPEAWAMRPQVGLYIWAAEQIYGEEFDGICLNVCSRQSPAGREPCSFRRDALERAPEDKERAVRNITWVADQIEHMRQDCGDAEWPFDGENCCKLNWKCDYYALHRYGKTPETLVKFQPAEEYLAL